MSRIPLLTLLLFALTALVASSPPTFCKCTCFTNSTIIPLGPTPSDPKKPADGGGANASPRAASSSCTQCNRAFCLQYNLPICKGAEEKDVVTQCFARDSRKDQLIVWAFILGTTGLLGWAGFRRAVEARERKRAAVEAGGAPPVPVGSFMGGRRGARSPRAAEYVPVVDGQDEGVSSGIRGGGR